MTQFAFRNVIGLVVALVVSNAVCSAENIVINGSFEEVGSNGLTTGWNADADGDTEFSFVTDWATDGERAAMLGVQSGVRLGRAFLTQTQRLFPQEEAQLAVSFDAIVERTGSPETFATLELFNNVRGAPVTELNFDLPDTAGTIQRFEVGPIFVPAIGEFPNDRAAFDFAVNVRKTDVTSSAIVFVDNFQIDLTTVPEPASWTLMVGPLFVLTRMLRRRLR